MLGMASSTCFIAYLHMLSSSWFAWHSPHAWYHVSIWYSPHAWDGILHMLCIVSPYAMLLMLGMAFSTCFPSCLHMLFSSWFAWHSPHGWHHVSICYCPYGFYDILHMLDIISPYAFLLMVCTKFSTCSKSCLPMLFSLWFEIMCPYAFNLVSRTRANHEDTFCKSIRTHGCVHMVFDTWFYTVLLMV